MEKLHFLTIVISSFQHLWAGKKSLNSMEENENA